MSKVSIRDSPRQTHAIAHPILPSALFSIAALSLNVAIDPKLGKSDRATLELLQQAVELTRPWTESVLDDLVHQVPSLAFRDDHGTARRTRSFQDRGRLGTLLSLLSQCWKVSRLLKCGDGVSRQAIVVRRLYAALCAELASAEDEIERLKALLQDERGESVRRRRRRRIGTSKMGSADQSEDVAVVAIEDVDESPLSDLSGDKAVDGTLADGEAVAETNYVEQGDAPQKWRRASVKTSESAPSSQVPSEVRLRATASEPHGIARAEPGNASGRAREGPEVDNHNGKRTNTSHDTSRKLSKMSKSRADSKFSNIGLESTKERSRKLFPRSSTDLPRPRWAKDKEPRSPATFRSDTASLSSKRSAVLKEVASAKASSIGPQRGRRTSSNDLNKKYAAGEAVAPSTSDFSEAVTTGHGPSQEEVGVVSTNDEAKPTTSRTSGSRSHRSSRTGSAVIKAVAAADTVPGNEREPKNLGLADDTPKARSKATSRASEGSRSKRCPGSAEDGASDFGQSETQKPAATPSSSGSQKSSKSHSGVRDGSQHSKAHSPSQARTPSESRSISPDVSQRSANSATTSHAGSASLPTMKSTRSHHFQHTISGNDKVTAAKRTESVESAGLGYQCNEPLSRPRKCHHAGSLASSDCDSRAWSCEVSLDAEGVLQLKAEHFHRRPDGC